MKIVLVFLTLIAFCSCSEMNMSITDGISMAQKYEERNLDLNEVSECLEGPPLTPANSHLVRDGQIALILKEECVFEFMGIEPTPDVPTVISNSLSNFEKVGTHIGRIEIEFDRNVVGNCWLEMLHNGEWHDAGWIGQIRDTMLTLDRVRGKDLNPNSNYKIVYNVSDIKGVELRSEYEFSTEE